MESNPRHQGLNTHKYSSLRGLSNEEMFEAYAEIIRRKRIEFFGIGPEKKQITMIAITHLPDPFSCNKKDTGSILVDLSHHQN